MTIYIDEEFKCYMRNDGTMYAVETDFFDGKCTEFIEGYRYIPAGKTWVREDGEVFRGDMIAPWKDYDQLARYQALYEQMLAHQTESQILKVQNADYEVALTEIENALGVAS